MGLRARTSPRMTRPIGAPPWVERTAMSKASRTRLKPRRTSERRRDPEVVSLPEYLTFLRGDICGVANELGHTRDCAGPIDPEHERKASVGMGQAASDDRAWSCCRKHHRERHDNNGFFKGWGRARLTRFIDRRIGISWARYTRHRGIAV